MHVARSFDGKKRAMLVGMRAAGVLPRRISKCEKCHDRLYPGHDRIKRLVSGNMRNDTYVAGAEDPCQNIKPFLSRSNFE